MFCTKPCCAGGRALLLSGAKAPFRRPTSGSVLSLTTMALENLEMSERTDGPTLGLRVRANRLVPYEHLIRQLIS